MTARKRLTPATREELRRRYIAKVAADAALADYLLGVLHQVGVDPRVYRGFDDVTGAILLMPPPPAEPATPVSSAEPSIEETA